MSKLRSITPSGARSAFRARVPKNPGIALAVAMVLGGFAVPSAGQDYDPADIVPTALEVYNERAEDPLPFLTPDQIVDLVKGDVVRVRRKDPRLGDEGPERVTGYMLLRRPRLAVWLAALDPDFPSNSMLTEVQLMRDDSGRSQWYQHLSLPWPIADRHWVVTLQKDIEMARATDGFVWVHEWNLSENGEQLARETVAAGKAGDLTLKSIEKAIYLPSNEGAWILFSLDSELTLLAYRVTTVVGGGIPDSWIATFAMAQLEGLLHEVDELAETSEANYDPEMHPAYDGFGKLIERP